MSGAVVVFSGGLYDGMNPPEVRKRMEEVVEAIGLPWQLLANQPKKYLHQVQYAQAYEALRDLAPSPLIVVGHSNGGAAALSLARSLEVERIAIDLLVTCDSVPTLGDNGSAYHVPSNVRLNINTYTVPQAAFGFAPFPVGRPNEREEGAQADILNIGLCFNLPGALAHRNAFYAVAGGDKRWLRGYQYPNVIVDAARAVMAGRAGLDVLHEAAESLRVLGEKARIDVMVQVLRPTSAEMRAHV